MPSSKAMAKQIKDDLLRYLIGIQASLDERTASAIGNAVVAGMLNAISKGISPIEGAGRFPAYLSQARGKAYRQSLRQFSADGKRRQQNARQLKAQAKFLKLTKVLRSRNNVRASRANLKSRRALLKREASIIKAGKASTRDALKASKRGYPYSVQHEFPGKRPRPVNLFLSGDFLAALEYVVTGKAGEFGIELGFFDEDQAIKEQGHREQANGQGFRPIIPIGREDFSVTIQRAIIKIVEEEIDRAAVLTSR